MFCDVQLLSKNMILREHFLFFLRSSSILVLQLSWLVKIGLLRNWVPRLYFIATFRVIISDFRPRDAICDALYWDNAKFPLTLNTSVNNPLISSNPNGTFFGEWDSSIKQKNLLILFFIFDLIQSLRYHKYNTSFWFLTLIFQTSLENCTNLALIRNAS